MVRQNPANFYLLGIHLSVIDRIRRGESLDRIVAAGLYNSVYALEFIIANTALPHTQQRAKDLLSVIGEIIPLSESSVVPRNFDRSITDEEERKIAPLTFAFAEIFMAELATLPVFYIPPFRGYDIETLIQSAEKLFADEIVSQFSDDTKHDMKEAGRCLAFKTSTACAFHFLRGTERELIKYLNKWNAQPTSKNWGAYEEALKKTSASPQIISMIKYIRETFRNPVLHPEEFVDVDEAELILTNCKNLIVAMIKNNPIVLPAVIQGQKS